MSEGIYASPTFERRVATSNIGKRNTVNVRDPKCRAIIYETLKSIEKALLLRCGPTAGYTMIVDGFANRGTFRPNTFTRDGIDVLNAIEFMSPIESIQKDIITYVGDRVEGDAKDGTTTSMLFVTRLLLHLNELRDDMFESKVSVHYLNHTVHELFKDILRELEKHKFTYEGLRNIYNNTNSNNQYEGYQIFCGMVAYMQAMSSSGGNHQLADVMRKIFAASPKDTWNSMEYRVSARETEDIYMVEVDEFQHRLSVSLWNDVANELMNTEYIAEDVEVIIYSDKLDKFMVDYDKLISYINTIPTDKPIVFISPLISPDLEDKVRELNKDRSAKIALFQYNATAIHQNVDLYYELTILMARAGVKVPMDSNIIEDDEAYTSDNTFECKRVRYANGMIEFYDFIDELDICLHPYQVHPEQATRHWNETMSMITRGLENSTDNHESKAKLQELFRNMYDSMIELRRPHLKVGGTTHDNIAAQPVVRDVQGAIMASLRDGFMINGVLGVYSAIASLESKYNRFEKGSLERNLYDSVLESIQFIAAHVHLNDGDDLTMDDIRCSTYQYRNTLDNRRNRTTKSELFEYLKILNKHIESDEVNKMTNGDMLALVTNYPVLSPYAITTELFKRAKEILPKYFAADNMIISGGVVDQEHIDEWAIANGYELMAGCGPEKFKFVVDPYTTNHKGI